MTACAAVTRQIAHVVAGLGLLVSCSAGEVADLDNPTRARLELALRSHTAAGPLEARYNPTTCVCPPLEVLVDGVWLRSELTGDPEGFKAPMTLLARVPLEELPVAVGLEGRLDPTLQRTVGGTYAVRVEGARLTLRKN